MTPESSYLFAIAQEVAEAYATHTRSRAVLLTGSVATGDADAHSDIDLVVYYDELLSECERGEARERIRRIGGTLVETTAGDLWILRGVECQVGFITVET